MGKKTGSGAGLGAVAGIIAGAALAPFTGGASLAILAAGGASLGAGTGAVVGMQADAKDASKKLQRDLANANRQEKKPTIPNQDMDQIRASKNLKAIQLAQRSGRESTVLTEKFGG